MSSICRLNMLGVPLDCASMAQSVDQIRHYLSGQDFHLVVTLGSEMVMRAQSDAQFRAVVQGASLIVPDSIGPVLAARYNGHPVRERVTGVELIRVLAQQLGPRLRLFLLGGAPGVAEEAASHLVRSGPGVVVVGCRDGFFQDSQEVVQQIADSKANLLLVALGSPRQELWLAEHGVATGVQVGIGVGGSFDVLSGRVKRAPVWLQRSGLEWLYRLVSQPSRWRRMLSLPRFAVKVLKAGRKGIPVQSPAYLEGAQ